MKDIIYKKGGYGFKSGLKIKDFENTDSVLRIIEKLL